MGKSFIAKIEEKILKFTKPDYMTSQEKIDSYLLEKSEKPEETVKSSFKSTDFNGMQVFTFGEKKSKNTILFIHGGAYVNEINYQHFIFCSLMSKRLDAYVLAPVYPLAPLHEAEESYEKITDLYKHMLDFDSNITLMGDSAGGGFILSFCQFIKTISLPQPEHIITFSPWVDISMSNSPYDDEDDPILGEIGLREIGKSWAGKLDTHDYKVSPLFGDVSNQAPTLIFAGDSEIFYKDIRLYVEKLKKSDVDVRFITGEGLFHIYPLFPIPEAKKAFKEIKKEIMG
jgi:acetyl esterase/lipase